MYRYMADAGLFTECLTARRMGVAQERDNAALERAYSNARRQPGAEVKVFVEGRLATRPNPDSGAAQPALVVERFIRVAPGETCGVPLLPSPLETTFWRATQLAGKAVMSVSGTRELNLIFQTGGRVTGFDGCNSITGSYESKADAIRFGQMAGTLMACPNSAETERGFRDAVGGARRYRIIGDRLEL